MNPPADNQPGGMNLPPPIAGEALPPLPNGPVSASPEAAPSIETMPIPAAPSAAVSTAIPLPIPSVPLSDGLAGAVSTTATTDVPVTADDTDLIEKEWVEKAKQIVEKTREDPYLQSKEINVFKADYMKKRYNKTVKLSE